MKDLFRRKLLLGAVAAEVALCATGTRAFAQEESWQLEEIVVTAQKRAQSLYEVPATISAMSEAQITALGINNTIDLAQSTPGLTFGRTAAWTNFYMRGLGNAFNTPAAQSPVAVYVDGVYQADSAAMALALYGVERVEILKGPQGTLYGRNAVGGAINVITKAPSSDFEAKVRASMGNLGNQQYSGYVNGGSEVVQANLALDSHTRDGYNKNITPGKDDMDDIDDFAVRGKLRYTPNEVVDLTLAVDYSLQRGDGPGTVDLPYEPLPQAYLGSVLPTGQLLGGTMPSDRKWRTSVDADLAGRARDQGISLTGRFDFESFELLSITAGRDFENDHGIDFDSSSASVISWRAEDFHRQYSQEFQVLSTAEDRFSWIAGLYYLNDDAGFDPFVLSMSADVAPAAVYIQQNTKVRTDAYAAFAEGTYDITDEISVVLGGRYSVDDLEHYDARQTVTLAAAPIVLFETDSSGANESFDSFTPRVSLNYQRPEGLYYVTLSKGYASGLYNISNVAATRELDEPIDPEDVEAIEIGAKWRFLDDRVNLNVAGFYYDVKDLQTMQLAGSGLTTFENADGEIQGLDADVLWAVTPEFTLRAAFEILDASYSSYENATVYEPNLQQGNFAVAPCGLPFGQASANDAACVTVADLTDEDMMRSPELTSTVGFDWILPLRAESGSLTLTANWYHSDEYLTSVNGSIVSPEYDSYNASLSWLSPDEHWNLALWGKNLSDADYFLTSGDSNYGRQIMRAEPQTYGVTVEYSFGK